MNSLRGANRSRVLWRIGAFPILALLVGIIALDHQGKGAGGGEAPPYSPPKGPGVPNDWFYMQRAYPTGVINHEARYEAIRKARELRPEPGDLFGKVAPTQWESLGPTNIGGRITDIVADPGSFNVVYVGAASGGVWKSTDGGNSWAPIFDGYGSLSIGALAIDPNDINVLYVGTGEANPGGGSVAYGGDGLWKTTDGGQTWTHLGLDLTRYVGRIAVDPSDPSRVFVAATGNLFSTNPERGVYRSTDAGTTWEKVHFISDSTGCIDVAIDPSNPSRIYAAMWERIRRPDSRVYGGPTSGIWRSVDGGDSWTQLTTGLPSSAWEPGRIGLAVAPSSPSTVYAIYTDSTGYFGGLFRSIDNGDSWTQRAANGLNFFYSSYGWWFGRLWVDPLNENIVWADGISLYRSTNGGGSFSSIGSSMHVDHHAQHFDPTNPNLIWKGNDGGLYQSSSGGASWTSVGNLPITQYYTLDVHSSQPWKIYGGTQDNGTNRTPGGLLNDWEKIYGGDGHYVNVDPNNTNVIYVESQYGDLRKSINGGTSFFQAMTGISSGDRKNWSTPVVIDPASEGQAQTTLYYGANLLYRSTNSAGAWAAISGDLTDGNPGSNGVTFGTITTIAVAPSDSATIYLGTDDGNVWVTTVYGGVGNFSSISAGLPDRWVTRVAVDPFDDAVAYVTLSGFRDDDPLSHVFRTTDWGGSWSDISGNLPDAPVNDIIVDQDNTSRLYVASDVGVFFTNDLGGSWFVLGVGLPEGVVVTDLKYVGGGSPILYAATYGRSIYSYDLYQATSVAGSSGDSQSDEEGGRGFVKLALGQNQPNPWRTETRIQFALPAPARSRLEVFSVSGRRIRALVDGRLAAGPHDVVWDGRDQNGREVPSGVYLYRLEAEGEVLSHRMTLAR